MTVSWKTTQAQSQDAAINSAKGMLDPRTATAAATITLTTDQLINGLLHQTGGTTNTATTPTAAQIVAAIKNCVVGSHFFFGVINQGSGAVTVVGGTGVTVGTGGDVVPTLASAVLIGVVTNATLGSEAVFLAGGAAA